ncbi:MAG: tetratricopeptide repeat protein [Chitinispirillaceae bacterium]|nr:tetratricopeptide repeat protein [Chitinispirillaceae bacterium]
MPAIARQLLLASLAALVTVFAASADESIVDLVKAEKFKEAIQHAEKKVPAASRSVSDWISLATAYEKTGASRDLVLNCLKEAQRVNPSDPGVLGALGDFYSTAKNYTEALKYYQSSFLLKRSGPIAEKMALSAAHLNQMEKAKDAAESAIGLDSTVIECRPILIRQYLQEKNWQEASVHLAAVAKRGRASLEQWKQLADCYEKTGNKEGLAYADSTIVLLDKGNVPSRSRYAVYALSKGDTATALRFFKELAIITPKDALSFKHLYELSLARGNKEDGILYLKNYLVLDSTKMDRYWLLGDLLHEKKDYAGALDAYRQAFRKKPDQGKGHLRKYASLVLQNKLDNEAVNVITAAIAAGDADVELYTALGDIYRKQDKCSNAVKMYQDALKVEPKNLAVLSALADCQARTGDVKNAILSYEQIVLMNPKPSQEYKALGDLQMKVGKKENAIASYKKYLESVSNDYRVAKTVGLHAYEAKNYKEAVKYLGMVQDPSLRDVTLLTALGLSAFRLDDCNTTVDALGKAWAGRPAPTVRSQILIPLGECYEKTGNMPKAAEAYEAYVALPGVSNTDIAYRGAFLKERHDRGGAMKAYGANITNYPKDYRNFLRLGLLYAADSGALDKAATVLTAATALTDTVRVAWRTLATVQGKLKNQPKELAAWQKLAALEPQDPEANRRIGMIHFKSKQYAQAIAPLEIVATTAPQDYELLRMLATCYTETKRPQEALGLLRKAKVLKPDDPSIRVAIITAAAAIGPGEPVDKEKEELADIDQKIIARDKKNTESRVRLVEYYTAKKDYTRAFALLKELAALTPKDPVVFRKLYEIASRNNNKQEASEYLKKYLAIDPKNANAYKNLGDLLFEQKDHDGAFSAYRTAVSLNPQLKGFYKNYIAVVLHKKLDVEAIPVIQNAIKFGEATTPDYLALGDIYRKKNDCANAIKMYQEVLRLDPKNLDAMGYLGECQAMTGDVKNAIISYEQVVLMKPKPTKEYKMLGDLQVKAGKTSLAMDAYRKYLIEVPTDQTIARAVGLNEYEKQQFPEAIKYLELVKNANLQNAQYLVALGESYYKTANTPKTIELLSRAWAAKPAPATLEKVLKILAECYEKTNQPAKSLEVYDAYVKLPGVTDPEASYLRGFLREKTDRATAIKIYSANTTAFPKDYRSFLRLGLILAADPASQDKAAAVLKQTSTLVDTIPLLWETLASAYKKLNKADAELQALQKLLSLQPQNLEANKRASALLLEKKQVAQAITNLEMVLTMAPKDVPTMLLLVQGYLETKRPAQALELLEKAGNLEKNNVQIKTQLYDLSKQMGQHDKAETEIKALITLTKDNKYRLKYARDLLEKKRYEETAKILSDIKSNDPMNIEGLMLRGTMQKAQKKYDEAIETYKEISYINDDYAPALYERGDTYYLQQKYDRADQYFDKALKADPKLGMAALGLALSAKAQKRMTAYKDYLNKAKALDPKNPRVLDEAAKAGK